MQGERINLDELRDLVGPEVSEQVGDGEKALIDLTPEELEAVLSVMFFQGSNALLRKMNREKVSLEEADRWAKATRIVYGKYLMRVEATAALHGLFTLAIFSGKKKLPPPPTEGKP